jgi:predicted nuclease of predicted toxin-antitoxin system
MSARGHEATHVADLGLAAASDRVVWNHAVDVGAAIVTKDEDFAARRTFVPDGPQVVWLRIGNTRRAALLRWFERDFDEILTSLTCGESIVEVRAPQR